MSTTTELLKGAAELFPDEVVTSAHVRHLELPYGAGRFALITLDNGFDHTKPTTFGPASLANLNTAIDQVEKEASALRDRRCRHHRKALRLRRRRGPQGCRAAQEPRRRPRHRQGRPRGLQAPRGHRGADVHVLQRRGHGRRCRGRSALRVPHGVEAHRGLLAARGLPRPGPRLGRLHAAAEPDRRGEGRLGDHREQPQPEQAAQGPAGLRPRDRGRALRGRRLPGAVADLDGERPQGRHQGRASGDRPRRGLGPGRRQGPVRRGLQGARRGPGRLPRPRHHRRREERRPPAGLRRRGPGARRPDHGR